MASYDLVIRGGLLADGDGGPLREADVGVRGGRIAAVGPGLARGAQEHDARGLLVTPGFVDVHTHYDGQATWGSRMQPSSGHGVTTVVMGNCGVGFAPCRPGDRDRLIRLMEGVEDIPFPVLAEGLPWRWNSFADYLDFLEERAFDVDIGAQLPHAALRVYVMGERGADREPATAEDRAEMRRLACEAVRAGALGFSTSRTLNHRTSEGKPTPTLTAAEDELMEIALGLADAGSGVMQFVSDFERPDLEFDLLERLCRRSGRPLSFSLAQSPRRPEGWRHLLSRLERARAEGLPMRAQVAGRPVGILLGLELTLNPFSRAPAYRALAALPLAERVLRLRDPGVRAQLLEEVSGSDPDATVALSRRFETMYLVSDPPDYEPDPRDSVAAQARARGVPAEILALDHMLTEGGRGLLYLPFLNYAGGSLDATREMMTHPGAVAGLSDGGAHVGMICDASFPTTNLTHWARDRRRGPKIPLEVLICAQTRLTAEALGLHDRGRIAVGLRADLNLIDFDALGVSKPEVAHDLPAGGRRLAQRAQGYRATYLAGVATYLDGAPTGALPGRLLRGARPLALAAE